jgi:hypothetical protein
MINDPTTIHKARVVITDLKGKTVKELPVIVKQGMNEILYHHGYNMAGTFLYSLYVDDQLISTKKMVFAN